MRSKQMTVVLTISLILVGSTLRADLPGNRTRPRPQPQPLVPAVKVQSRVEINDQAKLEGEEAAAVAKVVIPRRILLQLLQQPAVAPGAAAERSEAPIGGTLIAAFCLTIAAVAAGLAWRQAASRRTTIAASILFAGLGFISSGYADVPPFKNDVQRQVLIDKNPQNRPTVILVAEPEEGPVRIFLKHAPTPKE